MKAIVPATVGPGGCEALPEFRRIARAIEFVAANVRQQPSLADMAAAANWSEYHFAREFRRWTGISPKQWLQELSLTAAKQALDDERSVLQAALDAGLSGSGRLHDLFVTLEAVTPGEYKSRGHGMTMQFGTAQSPFGTALIVRSGRGIAFLAFAGEDGSCDGFEAFRAAWRDANWERDDAGAKRIADTIWRAAPCADRKLTLWVHGSNFQLQVWRALLAAGQDRTLSYAALAESIGRKSASRAVGSAVGANPVAWLDPVPPRAARQWRAGGVSLGTRAQAGDARMGTRPVGQERFSSSRPSASRA